MAKKQHVVWTDTIIPDNMKIHETLTQRQSVPPKELCKQILELLWAQMSLQPEVTGSKQ